MYLFDTHTHFDAPDFDGDWAELAQAGKAVGVEALVHIGFLQSRFAELIQSHHFVQQSPKCTTSD